MLLESYKTNYIEGCSIQPVALLLLDINMPVMTGIEALSIIKKKFKETNKELISKGRTELIVRPVICFFSQQDKTTINMFLHKHE